MRDYAHGSQMTDAALDLSFVVVAHNSAAVVGLCLESLISQFPDCPVVVVDNASTDSTSDIVQSFRAPVTLVCGDRNRGYGRACNLGVKISPREHVLIMNPDVLITAVDTRSLSALLQAATLGLAAPTIARPDDLGGRPLIFAYPSPRKLWIHSTWRKILPRFLDGRRRTHHCQITNGWASGAALLVRRTEFEQVGGFDERFFLYYEDTDLSRRYHAAGFPIRGTDSILATHAGGSSCADRDLRIIPFAASLLGMLQYMCVYHPKAARSYGPRLVRRYRLLEQLSRLFCWLCRGKFRSARKLEQLSGVRSLFEDILTNGTYSIDGETYYPDAVCAMLQGTRGHSSELHIG